MGDVSPPSRSPRAETRDSCQDHPVLRTGLRRCGRPKAQRQDPGSVQRQPVVGKPYAAQLKLQPGDKLEIKLGRKLMLLTGHHRLHLSEKLLALGLLLGRCQHVVREDELLAPSILSWPAINGIINASDVVEMV